MLVCKLEMLGDRCCSLSSISDEWPAVMSIFGLLLDEEEEATTAFLALMTACWIFRTIG
jgi:hypothetical protein